ncbi:MAG: transcriptional regulator [Sulfuritalea sp.]|nr:transcriptional regulator [Sulfuritalea sp.]
MPIHTETRTLLTIVTEGVVENLLLADLDRLGVRGYTITNARGSGAHGLRDANWDAATNIRVEIICARAQAENLIEFLREHYFANYAMVTFLHEVEVLRPEKF